MTITNREKESQGRENEQNENRNRGSHDDEVTVHQCSSLFILPILHILTL